MGWVSLPLICWEDLGSRLHTRYGVGPTTMSPPTLILALDAPDDRMCRRNSVNLSTAEVHLGDLF